MFRSMILGAALVAAPLAAQTSPADGPGTPLPYDLGRDNDSPRSNAGALASRPGTIEANREAMAQSQASGSAIAGDQARYDADVVAYRAALRANARTVATDAVVQARNERAYAMAMADWRAQVRACDHGNTRACNAPTPDPAAYW